MICNIWAMSTPTSPDGTLATPVWLHRRRSRRYSNARRDFGIGHVTLQLERGLVEPPADKQSLGAL
jgi:hypothetical protein